MYTLHVLRFFTSCVTFLHYLCCIFTLQAHHIVALLNVSHNESLSFPFEGLFRHGRAGQRRQASLLQRQDRQAGHCPVCRDAKVCLWPWPRRHVEQGAAGQGGPLRDPRPADRVHEEQGVQAGPARGRQTHRGAGEHQQDAIQSGFCWGRRGQPVLRWLSAGRKSLLFLESLIVFCNIL